MRIGTAIAIYFVIWWTVLFVVLPLKIRTQGEAGTVVRGSESSAPNEPHLLLKAAMTTVLAAIVFLGLFAVMRSGLRLDDIPFFPKYGSNV